MRATILLTAVGLSTAILPSVEGAQPQEPAKLSEADAKRVAALIRQLDSPKFPEREVATRALADFGRAALDLLEKAAKGPLSAEAQRRLNQVLGKLRGPEHIAMLIRQLSAPFFRERQAAMMDLESIGRPALEQLRIATRSPEIEVARRAEVIIANILKKAR
ncbi:MAG TPA: hypothetical protein VEL76_05685 [Gemmataceae bacterium]|nr:hypothetical protein [Gemmataceae bacterium]